MKRGASVQQASRACPSHGPALPSWLWDRGQLSHLSRAQSGDHMYFEVIMRIKLKELERINFFIVSINEIRDYLHFLYFYFKFIRYFKQLLFLRNISLVFIFFFFYIYSLFGR